jgi:hypothetical protein
MQIIVMTDKDRLRAVSFCSALVSLGLLDIEEFMSVLSRIEDAVIEEDMTSEGFVLRLAEYYSSRYK